MTKAPKKVNNTPPDSILNELDNIQFTIGLAKHFIQVEKVQFPAICKDGSFKIGLQIKNDDIDKAKVDIRMIRPYLLKRFSKVKIGVVDLLGGMVIKSKRSTNGLFIYVEP